MSRFLVVSTYPAQGSSNIGDYLITQSIVRLIRAVAGSDVRIDVVWRGASWEEVSGLVLEADHIFFACLAIRAHMAEKIYPYAKNIVSSGVAYSVLAAGADLPVKEDVVFNEVYDDETVLLLKALGAGSKVFSTRGVLTQKLCRDLGIESSVYQGDVAFYEPAQYGKVFDFDLDTEIQSIVISDPHRPKHYLRSLSVLIEGLKAQFPSASLVMALHGVNDTVRDYCHANGVEISEIYQNREDGLQIYSDCDLHVGYRVHGHVSALKNRIPSYLLEQDGRGADYGLSLSRKVSVPHFLQHLSSSGVVNPRQEASIAPPQQILSMISQDVIDGFTRFRGFESELESISRRAELNMQNIVGTV